MMARLSLSRWSLSQRLGAVFTVLLLACCGAAAWLQMQSNERHAQVVIQRVSSGLAAHIAGSSALMEPGGLNQQAVRDLFHKLMDVNPSVEVYLLAPDGRIVAQAAPAGRLRRDRVDVAPIRRLLAGGELPIFGDDPRSAGAQKVFNAAPLQVEGRGAGYVYVVLHGEQLDAMAQHVAGDDVPRTALWAIALVAGFGLLAGLVAFHWITRPLRKLTDEVRRFGADASSTIAAPATAAMGAQARDEITTLRSAFAQMTQRIGEQWRELTTQDQQRRELVANISHDLRTPLTSLHGYLETLRVKADVLSAAERQRYLDVALAQSRKVGRLAQELFELARLEYGVVKLEKERFSVADLVQDVFQKFELAAESRKQCLTPVIAPDLPVVAADVGMIERVLTNLLDNAIRHTPPGGRIEVHVRRDGDAIDVLVSDTGPGIPVALQKTLFVRPSIQSGMRDSAGGLGLVIVRRILQLHGSDIRIVPRSAWGATFQFRLNPAGVARVVGSPLARAYEQ
jgi:signal transduction histidine kinase